MNPAVPPRQVVFDPTPEIYATDSSGGFRFPLVVNGERQLPTGQFDEARILVSLWHPSSQRSIDLDRAYVEIQACFDSKEEHWVRLAEIEPVVSPYKPGQAFDGWVVLPILATQSAFLLAGGGFHPRARIQIRTGIYLVA